MAGSNLDLAVRLKFIDQGLKPAIDSIKSALGGLKSQFKSADVGFSKSIQDTKTLNTELSKTEGLVKRAFSAVAVVALAKESLTLAETYKTINAQLKNAADSQDDYNASQKDTLDISLKTGTSLKENVSLYQKLKVNAGQSSSEAKKLVDTIAKAARLDGGGPGAQAAINQFGQSATSGVLGGEELRSVREQLPTLAEEIRKGLGVTREEFGKLAKSGGIAFSEVTKALNKSADDINAKFGELPVTSGQAFENLKTNAIVKLGEIDAKLGASQGFTNIVNSIANNMNTAIVVTTTAIGIMTAAWLTSIATKRAAENAAHLAKLRELREEQAVSLQTALREGTAGAAAAAEKALASTTAQIAAAEKPAGLLATTLGRLMGAFRFLLNPIGIVLGLLGAVAGYLAVNSDKTVEFAGKTTTLGGVVQAVWTTIKNLVLDTLSAISEATGISAQDLLDIWTSLKTFVGGVFAGLLASVEVIINGIYIGFNGIAKVAGATAAFLVERFKSSLVLIKDLFVALGKDIAAALTGKSFAADNLKAALTKGVSEAKNQGAQYIDTLKGIAKEEEAFLNNGGVFGALKRKIAENLPTAGEAAKIKTKAKEKTGSTTNTGGGTSNKLPALEKVARDEVTLQQAVLDEKKAANERQYAEDIQLAGDNVTKKLELTTAYYKRLNELAVEQSNLTKKSIEEELKVKQAQQKALEAFTPKGKGSALENAKTEKANKLDALAVEIANLNAKILAENTKLDTTLSDNNSKLRLATQEVLQKQVEATKSIDEEITSLNKEAEALYGGEEAYKEYLIQKTLATELAKLEAAGIDKTTEAYQRQAAALEEALRNKQSADEAKKKADTQKQQEDEVYKNVQKGVQSAFANGLKSLGKSGSLQELALNAATTIRDALAEAIAGNLANSFLNAIGGKDTVLDITGALGIGGKKGDSITDPLYTKSVDQSGVAVEDVIKEETTGLFGQVSSLFFSLSEGFSGFFSKISGLLGSLFSGGGSGSGGGGLGGIFSFFGSMLGFADGGLLSGPGTGTSDSILATNGNRMVRFSDGEYVVRQSQTSKWLPLLNAINYGALDGVASRIGGGFKTSFATGGLIEPGAIPSSGQGGQTTRIVNVIDPKMAGEYLSSPAGEKTILNVIRRNKSGVQSVLR